MNSNGLDDYTILFSARLYRASLYVSFSLSLSLYNCDGNVKLWSQLRCFTIQGESFIAKRFDNRSALI